MTPSTGLLRLELILAGMSAVAATVGYVLAIPNLELIGILGTCISLGVLIARAMTDSAL
jgi:hypothetical protein